MRERAWTSNPLDESVVAKGSVASGLSISVRSAQAAAVRPNSCRNSQPALAQRTVRRDIISGWLTPERERLRTTGGCDLQLSDV